MKVLIALILLAALVGFIRLAMRPTSGRTSSRADYGSGADASGGEIWTGDPSHGHHHHDGGSSHGELGGGDAGGGDAGGGDGGGGSD